MTRSQRIGWIVTQLALMLVMSGFCVFAGTFNVPFTMLAFLIMVGVSIGIAVLVGLVVTSYIRKIDV